MTTLTQSNQQIIRLLAEGKAIKEVAAELNLSERTIEVRLKNMRRQHQCVNSLQLVVKLLELPVADAVSDS